MAEDVQPDMRKALYNEEESKTNRNNVKYLLVLAIILFFCEILNEIGIFQVAPLVMRIGISFGVIFLLIPLLFTWRTLSVFKSDGHAEYRAWHKYFIILFAWLGTIISCVTLTHHTVMTMSVPILMMAQYRSNKQLVPLTAVLATVCVFASVYGGYFYGCFDGNLLHLAISDDIAFDLGLRASIADAERMTDLFTHYVFPRELIVLSLLFLATKISHRNNEMLDRQALLQSKVEENMRRTNELQQQVISGMANLIENRDESTGEHVKRTTFYVRCILDALRENPGYGVNITDKEADTIVSAAPLHDVGKIVVSDRILLKPGKLTQEEFDEIKEHASEGARVIESVLGGLEDADFLRLAKEIAGDHHERWDGKGYPAALSGKDIPLSARIMAVADVFDALVSERVYKLPLPPEVAFHLIEAASGKQFDPAVVSAFCSRKDEILRCLSEESDNPPKPKPEQSDDSSDEFIE